MAFVRLECREHLAGPGEVPQPGGFAGEPGARAADHATAAVVSSRSGRFAFSWMRTLTIFETPASCMVTP